MKNLEWPQALLVKGKLEQVFKDSEIDLTVSELALITDLRDKLEKHLPLLSMAGERLKEAKLSIEDVLYVSSKLRRSE